MCVCISVCMSVCGTSVCVWCVHAYVCGVCVCMCVCVCECACMSVRDEGGWGRERRVRV